MVKTGDGIMAKYLVGLDNGGTSTKAAVFDLFGNEISTAGKHTRTITPKPGYTERDMEELWLANCDCIKTIKGPYIRLDILSKEISNSLQ